MPFSQSGLRLIGSHLLVGIAREKMAQRTESIQKQKAQVGMSPASYIKQLEAVAYRTWLWEWLGLPASQRAPRPRAFRWPACQCDYQRRLDRNSIDQSYNKMPPSTCLTSGYSRVQHIWRLFAHRDTLSRLLKPCWPLYLACLHAW